MGSSELLTARLPERTVQFWDGGGEFVTIAGPSCQGDAVQRVKKIVLWTLLAFFVYAIVKSPSQAADIARNIWDIIAQGFSAVSSFFDALLNKK